MYFSINGTNASTKRRLKLNFINNALRQHRFSFRFEQPPHSSRQVVANPEGEASTVNIGDFNNQPGIGVVAVTAEDGSTKEYTINVTVAEEVVAGIGDGNSAGALKGYPKPAEQNAKTVSFDVQRSRVESLPVVDEPGNMVKELTQESRNTETYKVELNTAGLSPYQLLTGPQ